ncbi:MAG: prepilin peptidase-dependent protein [Rouxiella aceris]|uniref:prepilin peptidase-dependent protein n=1 Tax=Rouxiella aceris TaxID=2703884 RepID=UPI002851748C|nr:prepilin peptidase-dependent protein [Rouxiella aceris]MDR3431800.1 prepilin peptidase-dependent protein [Rouxiella aceris]
MKTYPLAGEQGMTLIEVMLVLALIAMLSLWSLSGWRAYQQRLQLEQQVQHLRIYLTQLQITAYQYNQTRLLWIIDGPGGCVGSGVKPATCLQAGSASFQLARQDMTITAYSEKIMGFYGRRNMAQAGHITLSNAAGKVRLILSARGRLRLCSEAQPMAGIALC